MMQGSRNPVAGNAWRYNKAKFITSKKLRNDRKKVNEDLKKFRFGV